MNQDLKSRLVDLIAEIRAENGNSGLEVYFSTEGAHLSLDDWETSLTWYSSSTHC